jgi:hypothetical protein
MVVLNGGHQKGVTSKMTNNSGKRAREEIELENIDIEHHQVKRAKIEEPSEVKEEVEEEDDDEVINFGKIPSQALCEEQFKYYMKHSARCPNQLQAMQMMDEVRYYKEILERLYPSSKVLIPRDDYDTDEEEEVAVPAVPTQYPTEWDDDEVENGNTNDIDTDVE